VAVATHTLGMKFRKTTEQDLQTNNWKPPSGELLLCNCV